MGATAKVGSTPDPYRRRREAGNASREQTRKRLLAAADALFREQGYVATTVTAIAARANVSLQTLYLAWGSKRALLQAAADAAAVAGETPLQADEWRSLVHAELAGDLGSAPTAAEYLASVSRYFVGVARRTSPYWQMYRQAAALDPEIAADWQTTVAERRQTLVEVARAIPQRDLRPELTDHAVADTLWALASPEVYHLLTSDGGHSPATFQKWIEATLIAALCVDSPQNRTRRAPEFNRGASPQ